ncbi:AAA family ATPase [Pseudomonas fluorescens group sp.]|uniref:Nuclease SbcCD subunit C n=2 Tax=Pseudomonas fluorescens TaxID=294 RepID=C3KDI2_PSEFS|nr:MULTISPECIES: SbcC/MukB-like Walker B domain-containing protein [Pseudomonas fluorescens group]MBZ6456208.1 AAA family ATPase [Pseudomonas fluorescens group sp.]MBZ6460519.1 AAA family ATPase [Pseudomonas fluorescens group sp.]MBZ6466161.1 AAA family ATPase [Pseudomonas fluorescens group sp.]WQD69872.1 AAA family ATPase [Pseudomonas marginalis]CAI2797721.1 Exonuclease [Pseudomonas fluorescens SBW25]
MKILAIRLKNLASLAGPFEIDFTAEPLASAGLFAITGPTGAGKSTLLDALCLALFGAVPRLGDTGQAKMPDADSDISIGDPRTLLRRGTGGGYAEVDFVGVSGRRYRARWEANRARDKASGKLQNSRQSLIDLDSDQLLASQKTEYKTQLELSLGLNFEQFTRAVLLAQSEFSAFLKANDNERSELLEKLTDTALYTQLGRRAFDKAKDARDAHKQLQDQATGVVPLAAEARAELDQQFDAAQQQLKAQQAQLKQLELQHTWLKELREWQERQLAATEQLQRAQAEWDTQAPQRQDLSRLEQLAPQRHQFARQAELNTVLAPLAEQIQSHSQQQAELHTRQEQAQQQQASAQTALAAALKHQGDAAPLLRQAFEEQSTLAHLTKALAKRTEDKQQHETACAEGQSQLNGLLEKQRQVAERLQRLATELDRSAALAPLSDAWSAYRDRLQQLMLIGNRLNKGQAELPQLEQRATAAVEQFTQQREALDLLYQEAGAEPHAVAEQIQLLASLLQDNRKQQRAFEDLTRLWDSQQQLDQQASALTQKLTDAQQQREQLNQTGLHTKAELAIAEQTLTVTKQLLERQRLARSASVEELRAQLQDDQPCPVCGSHEHPYHQPEALLQSLGRHDENEEATAQKAVDTLKEKLTELRGEVGGLIAQQKEYLQQQEQLATHQQALKPSLEAHPLAATLFNQDAAKRSAWLDQQLSQLTQSITQDEQRQAALLNLQQNAGRLQQQVQAAQEASQQARQLLVDQQRELASDRERLEQELNAFTSLLPADTLEGLRAEPAATFMQLDQQVSQRLEQLGHQRDELAEQQERQQAIEKEQTHQQHRQQQLEALVQQVTELATQQQAAQQTLSALLGEHSSAEQWQQHVDQAVTLSRQNETDANQQLQAIHNARLQLTADLKALHERQQALQAEQHSLDTRISEWRALHPELDDEGLNRLLAYDDAQVSQLRQQLQHSEKAVEQAKVLLQEREQRLAEHQALHNGNLDTEALDSALASLNQQLAEGEKQCAELRARQSEDQRRQDANQAFAEQIAKAYDEWQRWARLNALIGSATGDTFRKIAQAYNLDLLVHHANVQLRQLVRRYRLKRGGSMLGLLVMDTEMGDELRSVHSLSGGETFLVSLALALGLASMASSTLKIESLFIDEGFGSLDPESLQLAMDALDGLQAQGRKVAVISHVQEMHERIPVQIQVKRQGNGLSTLEVK